MSATLFPDSANELFAFRPWVRRAGASIIAVAAAISLGIALALFVRPSFRFGWVREPFVWVYIGTLWLGGIKVFVGTIRPVAEVWEEELVVRPLHQFFTKRIAWSAVRGTEQLIGGDRLILYYDTPRGMRFVALNLNLVRRRKDFLLLLDARLRSMGFAEKIVERSRYLSRRMKDEG